MILNMIFYDKTLVFSNTNLSKTFQIHLNKPILDVCWLVGFFEGDGCLSIYQPAGKRPVCSFILRQADPKVLYKVQKFVGYGSVYTDANGYWTYSVRNKAGLLKIAKMLNGKLVLQKRLKQFETWVIALKLQLKVSDIPGLNVCTKPAVLSWENAWLTGFADADGSFNIQWILRRDNQKPRLRLRFYLDQANSYDSIVALQLWLGGTLHLKTKKKINYHRLALDTFNKCKILISYFCKYPPLTTTLHVRFIRYARVYRWYVLKQWKMREESIKHLILLNKRLKKPTFDHVKHSFEPSSKLKIDKFSYYVFDKLKNFWNN